MRDPVDTLLFNDSPALTGSGLLELLNEMAWFTIPVVILVEFIFSAPFLNVTLQPFAHVLGSS
jgi:hypothetical protein